MTTAKWQKAMHTEKEYEEKKYTTNKCCKEGEKNGMEEENVG